MSRPFDHKTKVPEQVISNLNIGRRSFIKGLAGAGILSATQVEKAFAQTQAPLRVVFVALQHGWGLGSSLCEAITGTEYDFKMPSLWSPFEQIRDQVTIVDGLRGTFWGNAHDVSYSDLFTAGVAYKSPEERENLGGPFPLPTCPSIDYLLEKHHGKSALRFSVKYRSFGAAHHPLSFNNRLQSLPFYTTPYDAYKSIYESLPNSQSEKTSFKTGNEAIILNELFPYLSEDVNKLISTLGPNEANKLLSYLDASTALEKKLASSPATPITPGGTLAELSSVPAKKQVHNDSIDSYLDMIRVSLTNDTHRVAVLGIGGQNNVFDWTDTENNVRTGYSDYTGDFHHDIAHYKGKPEDSYKAMDGYTKYYAEKIANFAKMLRGTIDIDGNTLLDNTLIVLTGEVGDGNHGRRNKPHIVIGGGSRLKRGNQGMGRWIYTPRVDVSTVGTNDLNGKLVTLTDDADGRRGPISQFTHADLWTKVGQLSGLSIASVGLDAMNNQALDL